MRAGISSKVSITLAIIVIASAFSAWAFIEHFNTSIQGLRTQENGKKLVVFCAGSLYIPLTKIKNAFERAHPGVTVIIEPSGSVVAVRKVINLKRRDDVLALADYRLVPKYMMPTYATWVIGFSTNELVLTYTNRSRYGNLINSSNWFKLLERQDVKYGFSNPNNDPCGYRALIAIGLADIIYERGLLDKLVLSNTNIKSNMINGTLHIYVPADLHVKQKSNLVIRSKSVDLVSLLEAGVIDYAFEYRSVAIQHHLKYVELPSFINLGDLNCSKTYSRVVVHILYGTDKSRKITGAPIVYGVTIPTTAVNKSDALRFIRFILSEEGQKVFQNLGQRPLNKLIYIGKVPSELKEYP